MKLYIRSQDKEALVVADCLYYREDYNTIDEYDGFNENKVFTHLCGHEFELGHYKTKERCIEIIDEIQGLLRGDLHIFLTACDVPNEVYRDLVTRKNNTILCEPNIEYFQSNVMVYQMPEE